MLAKIIELYPTNRTNKYEDAAKSENTKRGYESAWRHFSNWCQQNNHPSLPSNPEVIISYLEYLADHEYKLSTIKHKLASIVHEHKVNEIEPPITYRVNETVKGIGRKKGKMQTPKQALILEDLKPIIDTIDISTMTGKRDKALILLGFALSSRRSELVSINIEDIIFIESKGIDVIVRQTKTDEIKRKSILYAHNKYCAIMALQGWLEASEIKEGAIFRSINRHGQMGDRLTSQTVNLIVKKYADNAGLDPSVFAGHSLRSGHATSAGEKGYNQSAIMKQGGWNTPVMASRYQQEGQRFENNTSAILRLL